MPRIARARLARRTLHLLLLLRSDFALCQF